MYTVLAPPEAPLPRPSPQSLANLDYILIRIVQHQHQQDDKEGHAHAEHGSGCHHEVFCRDVRELIQKFEAAKRRVGGIDVINARAI